MNSDYSGRNTWPCGSCGAPKSDNTTIPKDWRQFGAVEIRIAMGRHRPLCGSLHKGRKPILVNGSFTVSQRGCQLCGNETRKATGSLRPKVNAAVFDGTDAGLADYRDCH